MPPPREFLFSLDPVGIRLGLERIQALVDALGRPDRAYRSIIVAGTNGKGSVSAMTERGLRAAGYRTGRYTSPHLLHLEERFAIDGTDADARALDRAIARVQRAAGSLDGPPSYFEATTAAALELFRAAQVDVAVLEVGLGGRLDATNVTTPVAAAITAVDFDHQQLLGDTLAAIAAEKAGVIKRGGLAVLGANGPVVETVVADRCRAVGAGLVRATAGVEARTWLEGDRTMLELRTPDGNYGTLALGLRGRHQADNAVTAVRLLETLRARSLFDVPDHAIRTAVEDVLWPGRLELVRADGHDVLIDGAHNAAGAAALVAYLAEAYGRRLPLVVGMMGDKDVAAVAGALADAASIIVCTTAQNARAMPADELAAIVARRAPGLDVRVAGDPRDALRVAAAHGSPVVVAGSLYLAGEVRADIS